VIRFLRFLRRLPWYLCCWLPCVVILGWVCFGCWLHELLFDRRRGWFRV
jgi:hypothetical protein